MKRAETPASRVLRWRLVGGVRRLEAGIAKMNAKTVGGMRAVSGPDDAQGVDVSGGKREEAQILNIGFRGEDRSLGERGSAEDERRER